MPSMQLTANMTNSLDMQKIQKLMEKAKASILVGFPGGRVHMEAMHVMDNDEGDEKNGAQVSTNADGEDLETWELATMLHFGTAKIPARPFLDEGIESKSAELQEAVAKEVDKIAQDQKPNWDKIGTMAVGAVEEFVRSDYYKTRIPNAPYTIRRKGSDTPLIDSGDLLNSLTFIVEK